MFGTKQHLKDYLDTIRPWATGVEGRGWLPSDFEKPIPVAPDAPLTHETMWQPRADMKAYRTDPAHVIFPILPYELTVLDRLFLGQYHLQAVLTLNLWISNFNAMLDAINRATDIETRWTLTVMLHTGVIGTMNTNSLYSAYMNALATL